MTFDIKYLEAGALLLAGWFAGYWMMRLRERHHRIDLAESKEKSLQAARREAETVLREAQLKANEMAAKFREEIEASLAARRQEVSEWEQRLAQKEGLINKQLEGIVLQEKNLRQQEEMLQKFRADLEGEKLELQELVKVRKEELQKISHLREADARVILLREVENSSMKDAGDLTRHILENAKIKAEEQARRILSLAIQRYAASHTFENTTATVALTGDEMKGRIIGREGRNIRAFEAATGTTVLIDDTPNAVVLSGFDPVRREIARESMHRLILDGRIHPTRIEEVVAKVSQEMEESIIRAGEEAIYKTGLAPMHLEVVKRLGALRFRQSFSQNILDHSIEVAHLMGLMASELGLEIVPAKKAGLLHDIGKALNHEMEGSHAIIGAEFLKRYGESEDVLNGVASHHDEVPHTNLLGILVSAADAISASRPGARAESMTTYIKRLENLEQIGLSFAGVEKCFAVQAGRELRVVVQPNQVNDEQAFALAKNIARKIENELQYPGQIRITVVRETRCVEFAK